MHSIKTDVSVHGTTNIHKTLKVQGSAVFVSTIQGQDVDFKNASFNAIKAAGEISSAALSVSGDINVTGDLIGSETSNAVLHTISTDSVTATTLNTTDIVSSGTITSDTLINSNAINTKDITSTGVAIAKTINTSTITATGIATVNELNSATSVNAPVINTTTFNATNSTVANTLTTKDINSTGEIVAETITNSGSITSPVINSSTSINANAITSSTITNTDGIRTVDISSSGTASTNNITNTGNINTLNISSTGSVHANNLSSTGTITANDITSTGDLVANVISAGEISSPLILTSGTIVANAVSTGDITSTGTLNTANIINNGTITTNTVSVQTMQAESITVAGNVVTDDVQTNTVRASFLTVGNTKISSFSNNVSWVLEDGIAVSPAWEGLSLDGTEIQPLTTKIYGDLIDFLPLGPVGTAADPMNTVSSNVNARAVFQFEIIPAEAYTGSLQVLISNEAHGNTLIQYRLDATTLVDEVYVTVFDSPLWLSATESVIVKIIKDDGSYLSVRSNDAGTAPYIRSKIRIFTEQEVFNMSNIDLVVNSLENLTGDNRLDVLNLKNIDHLAVGTYMGEINFALPVSQFNGAIKGSCWVAMTSGTLDGIAFGVGDALISKSILQTVITINDTNLFTIKPNPNPVATTTNPGIVIAGNGIAVDGSGHISTKLGLGVSFDSNYNITADVANIDITQLKNYNSLQKGTFRGLIPSTLAALAPAVIGDFWKASTSGTIGSQTYNAGDELYCTVDTPTAPTDLSNFVYVAQTTSTMIGATSSTAGIGGIVPSPQAGDHNKTLFGDATYKTVLQPTDIVNSLSSSNTTAPLSAAQGTALSKLIETKSSISDIVDTLTSMSSTLPLSANQGRILKEIDNTKVNISDIVDALTSTSGTVPLSANQGYILNNKIALKFDKTDVIDNLTNNSPIKALSANQGLVLSSLIGTKVNTTDIADNLTTTSANVPLSANQGAVLSALIATKASSDDIVDNLTSMNATVALSANQGRVLKNITDTKVNTTDIVDALTSTSGTVPLSANQGSVLNVAIATKINTADVIDTVSSSSIVFPLSANQGRLLNIAIGTKVNTLDVVDNLSSTSVSFPLSANQGRLLSLSINGKVNITDIVDSLTSTSSIVPLSANQGRVLNVSISNKQNILVSGINIKTVNGNSLLGSGDIITNNDATTVLKGVVQLAGDLGGTAAAPTVSKVNGITITGTPSTGSLLVATSNSAASWQAQTVLATATSTANGEMSSTDKAKLDTLVGGNFVGSTSISNGTAGQVPAPLIADSYNHMLKANGTWGGINNAGRVSCYGTVSKASLLAYGPITANSAMTVTGNTTLYTGTTTGITVLLAGTYKISISAMVTSGLINAGHTMGISTGAGTAIISPSYRIDSLTLGAINTVSFTEIVTLTAGINVGCSYMSSSILNTYQGFTMVIEKLD